jgi:hypothetical protein
MTPIQSVAFSMFPDSPVSCPRELVRSMGEPLFSLSIYKLLCYRKRSPHQPAGSPHEIYMAFGSYCIEFEDGVYFGSVSDGQYFGRRWKGHLTSSTSLKVASRLESCDPTKVFFHAMRVCATKSEAVFHEHAMLVKAEVLTPHYVLNVMDKSDRKVRKSTAKLC